jgi:hypothetical protein
VIGWLRRWLTRTRTPEPTVPQWEPARDEHGREVPGVVYRNMTVDEIEQDREARRRNARPASWPHRGRDRGYRIPHEGIDHERVIAGLPAMP